MAKPKTLIISGLVLLAVSIGGGFYAFPWLMKSKIADFKSLKKGGQMRRDWSNTPLAVDFKIFLFNVTNADEIYNGAKPIVQEIGPYFYREWKSKVNLVDDEDEDTVTFQMMNTWYFDKKETKPLTGNEIIVIPHFMILVLAELTRQIKPVALNMVNKAIPHLFGSPQSAFVTTTPREILFDGLTINCTKSQEFAANAICDKVRADPSGLIPQTDGTFKFSIFAARNNTADKNTLTVNRGIRDIKQVGQVVKFNGKTEMNNWDGMPCNQIKGTDTTIFAPFMEGTDDIWNFGGEVCRSIPVKYVEDREFKGIHCMYYEGDLGDMSTDDDLKCFCPLNTTGQCLKRGAMDVQRCVGVPFILTLPHCYLCDDEYVNGVVGLNPDKEKHGLFSYFEPITGTPVSGRRRMQFNMWLKNEAKVSVMNNLPEQPVLMPLFWVEEGLALNDSMATMVRQMIYRPINIVKIVRIVVLILGTMLVIGGVYLNYKRNKLDSEYSPNGGTKTISAQVNQF